jgi:hypothetical protein
MILLQATTDAVSTPQTVSLWDTFFGGSTFELAKLSIKFVCRFALDILAMIMLTSVYRKVHKTSELFFTFFTFNMVIFLICFLLNRVDLSMGAAFGLFAVFSMLRYRTEDISLRDMTYLFLAIATGLISAVTRIKDTADIYEYIFICIILGMVLIITWILETGKLFRKESAQSVIYENIELIKPERKQELMADLKTRTGLNIHRISIGKIDFLKDTALIKIYYYDN